MRVAWWRPQLFLQGAPQSKRVKAPQACATLGTLTPFGGCHFDVTFGIALANCEDNLLAYGTCPAARMISYKSEPTYVSTTLYHAAPTEAGSGSPPLEPPHEVGLVPIFWTWSLCWIISSINP